MRKDYTNLEVVGDLSAKKIRSGLTTTIESFEFPNQIGNLGEVLTVVTAATSSGKALVFAPTDGGGVQTINAISPVSSNFNVVQGAGIDVISTIGGVIIQLYTAITSAISIAIPIVEKGITVTSVSLSWSYNKTETSQSLNNGIGTVTTGIRAYTHSPVSHVSNVTYTVTASDGRTSTNANVTLGFQQKRWWGNDPIVTPTSSTILGLDNSEFATSRVKTFTLNGGGQYMYYAYPASFGGASFTVNGLSNTAWTLTVVSHTNASGYTENYNVYRSNTIQFGTLTIGIA